MPAGRLAWLYIIYSVGFVIFVWIVMQLRVWDAKQERRFEERYKRP